MHLKYVIFTEKTFLEVKSMTFEKYGSIEIVVRWLRHRRISYNGDFIDRMKLMELEKKNPTTRSSTSTSTTSTTTIIPSSASTTETTQHESTGTTRSTTITTETIVSESTSRTTSWGRRTWLRNRNEETLRKLRRKIFKSATFVSRCNTLMESKVFLFVQYIVLVFDLSPKTLRSLIGGNTELAN